MPGSEPTIYTEDESQRDRGDTEPRLEISHDHTSTQPVDVAPQPLTDPKVEAAGQAAYEKVLAGVDASLLSDSEKEVFRAVAARHRETAEQEAAAEVEASPETQLLSKLDTIRERLHALGLDADAEAIAGEAGRIKGLITNLAGYLVSKPEELYYHQQRADSPDQGRITLLAQKEGVADTNLISGFQLSTDLGGGGRSARSGTTYRNAEELEQYKDSVEVNGGLLPILSDPALTIVLEEFGVLQPGESLYSLLEEKERPQLRSYTKDHRGVGNGFNLTKEVPGGILYYRVAPGQSSGTEKGLHIGFNPGFIIGSAVQKAEVS